MYDDAKYVQPNVYACVKEMQKLHIMEKRLVLCAVGKKKKGCTHNCRKPLFPVCLFVRKEMQETNIIVVSLLEMHNIIQLGKAAGECAF
jgi:hypothetical protein